MRQDAYGNEIEVGDTVAFVHSNTEISKGEIIAFTPCFITIRYGDEYKWKVNKRQSQVVKI